MRVKGKKRLVEGWGGTLWLDGGGVLRAWGVGRGMSMDGPQGLLLTGWSDRPPPSPERLTQRPGPKANNWGVGLGEAETLGQPPTPHPATGLVIPWA